MSLSLHLSTLPHTLTHRGKRDNQETEEEEEVVSAKWTLRKQAALVLDNLAVTFSAALVLPHALSAIQIKLQAGGSSQEVRVSVLCSELFVCLFSISDSSH